MIIEPLASMQVYSYFRRFGLVERWRKGQAYRIQKGVAMLKENACVKG